MNLDAAILRLYRFLCVDFYEMSQLKINATLLVYKLEPE